MAAIKLKISVVELTNVMLKFDEIKVYRSTTVQGGPYSEITGPGTRLTLVAGTTLYEYIDSPGGDSSYWYAFAFFNSSTLEEGAMSVGIQGEGVQGRYCSIADIRAEGVAETDYDDTRVDTIIQLASSMIDRFTGRWFEPRSATFNLDGSGRVSMILDQPIISITSIAIDDIVVGSDSYRVYNRHLTENLRYPDDRDNPRIEMVQPVVDSLLFKIGITNWTRGQQNIAVTGSFGYTDYDGTAEGKTPDLIKQACKLLTIRELTYKGDTDAASESGSAWRVSEMKTRDQTIKYSSPSGLTMGRAAVGRWTGDPAIDTILAGFRRPPTLRAV